MDYYVLLNIKRIFFSGSQLWKISVNIHKKYSRIWNLLFWSRLINISYTLANFTKINIYIYVKNEHVKSKILSLFWILLIIREIYAYRRCSYCILIFLYYREKKSVLILCGTTFKSFSKKKYLTFLRLVLIEMTQF